MIKKLNKILKIILKRTLELILEATAIIIIFIIIGIYIIPYFQKQDFIKKCLQENKSPEWCESVWIELSKLD